MYVGLLTGPFGDKDLDYVLDFAAGAGFGGLEVHVGRGCRVLDPFAAGKPEIIVKKFKDHNLEISSLAHYCNVFGGSKVDQNNAINTLKKTIDLAGKMKVATVCTLAGLAPAGKSREQCIDEDVPKVWGPLAKYAAERKVRLAFENWYATLIMNLANWERIFKVLPAKNVGLNFDPSHLHWMDIDYHYAVERFADRIFHTHAKDTYINWHTRRWVGNQGGGWWRYVIPGRGEINWGTYISCLRQNGYNGTLSIEHEDGSVGREEGFRFGCKYLRQFIDA